MSCSFYVFYLIMFGWYSYRYSFVNENIVVPMFKKIRNESCSHLTAHFLCSYSIHSERQCKLRRFLVKNVVPIACPITYTLSNWRMSCRYVTLSHRFWTHVIMSAMTSQINGVSIVCSTVCSGAYQRKHQSSASMAFVRGIHRSDRWIPLTKGQLGGNVSSWWRHCDKKN